MPKSNKYATLNAQIEIKDSEALNKVNKEKIHKEKEMKENEMQIKK